MRHTILTNGNDYSDELILVLLNNLGAVSGGRALSAGEISRIMGQDVKSVEESMNQLVAKNYIVEVKEGEFRRFFLTPEGILLVSKFYT